MAVFGVWLLSYEEAVALDTPTLFPVPDCNGLFVGVGVGVVGVGVGVWVVDW